MDMVRKQSSKEQLYVFQVKTGGDVGKFCRLMRYNYLFIKHGLVLVDLGT